MTARAARCWTTRLERDALHFGPGFVLIERAELQRVELLVCSADALIDVDDLGRAFTKCGRFPADVAPRALAAVRAMQLDSFVAGVSRPVMVMLDMVGGDVTETWISQKPTWRELRDALIGGAR